MVILSFLVTSCAIAKSSSTNTNDFYIYLTEYEEKPSEDPGYKEIEFQIVLVNQSKDKWGWLNWFYDSFPAKLVSDDGIEYTPGDGEYREICKYQPNGEIFCSPGKAAPKFNMLPPGFQTKFEIEKWKVGEAINNFTYKIDLNVSIDNDVKKIPLELEINENNVRSYTSQFINNMTWQEYKNWGVKDVLIMDPGQVVETDFGTMIFSNHFQLTEDPYFPPNVILSLPVEVFNSSNAYTLELENPINDSCVIGPNYSYVCNLNGGESLLINPGQSEIMEIKTSTYNLMNNDPPPQQIEYPVCFFSTKIDWEINNERYTDNLHIILCED